jgi:nitroreductase
VARARQTGRNFLFFDAPVGLIFTIDGTLTKHSWLDFGLFLQSLMLAAHARGLATCPQVAFVWYEAVISRHLALGPEERVVCGMSLGYADEDAVQVNATRAARPIYSLAGLRLESAQIRPGRGAMQVVQWRP